MEAIKQSLDQTIVVIFIFAVMGITGLGVIGVLFDNRFDNSIETNEQFKVTSDTSKYTCVISEADNDLQLNCLEMK
jgi:hypothetical protein